MHEKIERACMNECKQTFSGLKNRLYLTWVFEWEKGPKWKKQRERTTKMIKERETRKNDK